MLIIGYMKNKFLYQMICIFCAKAVRGGGAPAPMLSLQGGRGEKIIFSILKERKLEINWSESAPKRVNFSKFSGGGKKCW